jgi:hypothetical protein
MMIDFNTSQLTWIVIGACSLGGTGYLSMNEQVQSINTKLEVTNKQIEHNSEQLGKVILRMEELNKTLSERNKPDK